MITESKPDARRSVKATLLVFSDDWGRHPSSCQHLMRQLLPDYHIIWVNTIGTRTPKFDVATLSRAAGKLRDWMASSKPTAAPGRWLENGTGTLKSTANGEPPRDRPTESDTTEQNVRRASPQPVVTNPRMWPWFTKSIDRRINKFALTRQLTAALADVPQPAVAITTLPITADLVGELPVAKWVYYCVDDFSEWPGLDGSTLKRLDEVMLSKADTVVAVSGRLQELAREAGRESQLLTHGVDLEFWRSGLAGDVLSPYPGPRAVFWGVVDRRLDMPSIQGLRERMDVGSLVFFGPQQKPDPALLALEGCYFPGPLPFDQLPGVAATADVLIMPYADLPVTRAMQPLKLKEYLATGRPTVVNRLPAVTPLASMMDVAESTDDFASLVLARLASGTPAGQTQARQVLKTESWAEKARQLESWIMDGVELER